MRKVIQSQEAFERSTVQLAYELETYVQDSRRTFRRMMNALTRLTSFQHSLAPVDVPSRALFFPDSPKKPRPTLSTVEQVNAPEQSPANDALQRSENYWVNVSQMPLNELVNSFAKSLRNPILIVYFYDFLKSIDAVDLFDFWITSQRIVVKNDLDTLVPDLMAVYNAFIKKGGVQAIPFRSETVSEFAEAVKLKRIHFFVIEPALEEAAELLLQSFTRFIGSDFYAEFHERWQSSFGPAAGKGFRAAFMRKTILRASPRPGSTGSPSGSPRASTTTSVSEKRRNTSSRVRGPGLWAKIPVPKVPGLEELFEEWDLPKEVEGVLRDSCDSTIDVLALLTPVFLQAAVTDPKIRHFLSKAAYKLRLLLFLTESDFDDFDLARTHLVLLSCTSSFEELLAIEGEDDSAVPLGLLSDKGRKSLHNALSQANSCRLDVIEANLQINLERTASDLSEFPQDVLRALHGKYNLILQLIQNARSLASFGALWDLSRLEELQKILAPLVPWLADIQTQNKFDKGLILNKLRVVQEHCSSALKAPVKAPTTRPIARPQPLGPSAEDLSASGFTVRFTRPKNPPLMRMTSRLDSPDVEEPTLSIPEPSGLLGAQSFRRAAPTTRKLIRSSASVLSFTSLLNKEMPQLFSFSSLDYLGGPPVDPHTYPTYAIDSAQLESL